ncbi:hypothetical protein ACFFSY_10805 [Paenibacillus aurantiacus]|uniref:Uncharacterized protein n=1 Tax=Paenibacillus aurantiacus TaxID=1936118 RepID=A0ABV5KMK1_9BACL
MSKPNATAIACAITVTLSGILFFLAYLFTFTYRGAGHGISGNGNPGLLFVIPAVPIYLLTLIFTYLFVRSRMVDARIAQWIKVGLLLLALLCGAGEYGAVSGLLRHLGGGPGNPDSVIYHFGWLNQYTNKMYFNAYTFMIGLSLSAWTALMVQRRGRGETAG